jgi:phosphopantothenoylcysteine decarboxylase/phosphopantothenate--cysteine ligase
MSGNPLENKHIVLGITGSIAAYKGADLASKLTQAGALVDVILTDSAVRFVSSLTFHALTGRKVYGDADLWGGEGHIAHVGLGHAADLMVVAPASANTIAKLAQGIGDNLLTVTALAAHCPLIIAPAMDIGMYGHAATQANINILKERGATFIGPDEGRMASGLTGRGRFVEPAEILEHIRYLAGRDGPLKGRKIVVTAGGTREPIDPVRYISNRSSGKQGYAIAQAALDAGAEVTLISAPTCLTVPVGLNLIKVQTSEEMLNAVTVETKQADVLVMAAAVADFQPKQPSEQKIKKENGISQIELTPSEDIIAMIGKQKLTTGFPKILVGFAAETNDLIQNATAKLIAKKLDLIIANDVSSNESGFEVDNNRVTFLFGDGKQKSFPLQLKSEVAQQLIAFVIDQFAKV